MPNNEAAVALLKATMESLKRERMELVKEVALLERKALSAVVGHLRPELPPASDLDL